MTKQSYVAFLRACAKNKDLYRGTRVHADVLKLGLLEKSSYIATALVSMYAKCGVLSKARELLDGLLVRDIFSWNALISGYAQLGQGEEALSCYDQMQCEGLSPDEVTFTCILKACGNIGAANKGEQIHDEIARQGLLENDIVLGTALVDMYAKCGALAKAQQVLDELPARDVVSWNALIAGYAQHGQCEEALSCFERMQREGLSPNGKTLIYILKICGSTGAAERGGRIHDEIARQGLLGNDIVLGTALVDMYTKCGALSKAQMLLEELPIQNVVLWNALIAGYNQQGQGHDALNCYKQMQHKGLSLNAVTFICVLKACCIVGDVDKGEQIHDEIDRQRLLESNIVLGNALVDMYAKCGALMKAQRVLEALPARDVISWSALIAGYAQHGQGQNALNCFEQMQREGVSPNAVTYICILKACGSAGAAEKGEQIHDEIVRHGMLENNIALGNALVDMYAKCGALARAQKVLEDLPARDVISWSALIAGYTQHGQGEDALNCFEHMQCEGHAPNAVTFISIFKACGSIRAVEKGEELHSEIARQGLLGSNVVLGHALVDMYAKCGAIARAQQLLEELSIRDVVSWNTVIAGYTQQEQGQDALNCFQQMEHKGLFPDEVTFTCILKACGNIGALEKGEQIHDKIAGQGLLGSSIVLGNALVDMYAKCGALAKAQGVLDKLAFRNVVSWNALITGYASQGQGEEALSCFERMQCEGVSPDKVTFACILKACGSIGAAQKGEQIHDEIVRQGLLGNDIVLGTALVDMYAKCGALARAQKLLNELPVRDVISWNALIAGYVEQGQGQEALCCFERMRAEGLSPNTLTFIFIAKACGSIGAADKGEQIHDEIVRQGLLQNNVVLGTTLVDMFAKCGALTKARQVLEELHVQDVILWNALIAGYAQQGQGQDALNCFEQMQNKGFFPDDVTFTCILKVCGNIAAAEKGEQIHDVISRQGLLGYNVMLGNALVNMYAKCGALDKAQQVLEELPVQDVVSWNALIAGYTQQGQGQDALICFGKMQRKGLSPDEVTFTSISKACGSIGAVDMGEQIHNEIARQGLLGKNIVVGNALVDMYVKCGALAKAQQVLEELPVRDVISWSSLITGYAQQGQGQDALNCFEQMQHEGLSPNAITFSCMLNACSHSGLLYEGQVCFASMSTKYGVTPDLEHYACMVDLFGRAGHFNKAVALIKRMPASDYPAVWSTLLGACRKWGDVNVGRWAFEHAVQVDENDAAAYICMANIYAAAGMQEDAENFEAMRMFEQKHGKIQDVICGVI